MTRAALLARVSSSAQSAEMQLAELRAVAAHRGWTVVLEETDTGSGARADLPGRARVLEAARRGQVDVIAVWRLDRLGRSVRDLLEISEALRRAHVELVSLRDAVETGTPTGQLLFVVLGAIAQFERELIGERVRAGIEHARAQGVVVGRRRVDVDVAKALVFLDAGGTLRGTAAFFGVSPRTLERRVNEARARRLRTGTRCDCGWQGGAGAMRCPECGQAFDPGDVDVRQKPPPADPHDRGGKGNRVALRIAPGER